jgi:Na+/H+ antiporter NhaC
VFAGALLLTLNLFSAVADTAIIYRDMLSDSWHATIILFDFVIGGLVGMIYLSGGAHGFANMITSGVKTARGGQIAGAGMGCVIFFDDYSNTVIVGNGLRPVADTLKISKEKFSYILDSTAAPVATIALVSTWVGYEVGVIGDALPSTMGINPYTIFLHSIPYRFYSILAILLVFMVTISSRDFGPMLDAEYRARTTGKLMRDGATPLAGGAKLEVLEEAPKRAINMILPIIVLVGVALFGMWWTGGGMEPGKGFVDAISDADSMLALLWGSIAGTIVAIIMYSVQRIANLAQMMDAFISGAKMMVMANLVLISAWSIGAICEKVGTAEFVVNISKGVVTPWVLPALLFAISAFIAFSTGTSWGTMAIVLPIAVPMGIALGVPLHLAVAPVLTGGVWGDHCSPISDTTVMSSTFAGSDHIDHVKTQLPYALLAGGVAFLMFLLMPVKFESPLMLPIVWIVGAFLLYFMLRTLSNRSMKKRNISISDLRKM